MRWSRRSAADVLRSFFDEEAIMGPAALTGPMVWGITPEMPGSGLGALTHAMRHVGHGRPTGRRQRPGARHAARRVRGGRRHAAHEEPGRHDHVQRRTCQRHRPGRRHRDRCADRRVGLQPPRHVPALAEASAGIGGTIWSDAGATSATTRATNRRSTPCCPRRRYCAASTGRSGRPRRSRRASPTSTVVPQ